MTLRWALLTLGWIIVIAGAATGVWMAWVDEREPPMGGCAVLVPIIIGGIVLAIVTERTRPPKR